MKFLSSCIGRKCVVAITGMVMIFFVIFHMLGNLSLFLGQNTMNSYAQFLQNLGEILWIIRIFLLISIVLHIWFTITLYQENISSRKKNYAVKNTLGTTVYARFIRISGLTILAFVLYHLAQFTWQYLNPETRIWIDAKGRHDVYRMVVTAFSSPIISGFYILAVGLLGMHMRHGVASLFQTLGVTTKKMRPFFERGGLILAWTVFLGFASIPAAVLAGLIKTSSTINSH